MEQFLFYLLRASILMTLFYGFYRFFFGKNTFHHFNRFLLIFIVMMVTVLPLFRFNLLPERKSEPVASENFPMDFSNIPIVEISELPAQPVQIPWIEILSVVFAVGFLLSVVRYLIGLSQLISIIRKSEKQTLSDNNMVLCITDKDISPFSWMKYIVLSCKDVSADNRAIINHERAHIHLQHSFDMIFFDLFTCIFWFNPFSWLLRYEIQSVHEYQADEQVLNNGIDVKQYQLLLIRKSVGEHKFALANNFRQRDLHKRITMMKNKSDKRQKWNYTAALPVLFLAMVTLSAPQLNAEIPEKVTNKPVENNKDVLPALEGKNDNNEKISERSKITICGFVKGKDSFIPGVTIVIKGSTVGTITDPEGKFVIKTDKGDVLKFVMVGYKTFEYRVEKTQDNLVVVLQPDDVVATRVGKMENFKIEAKDEQQPKIAVYGLKALTGNPLFILDGKPIEPMNDIDPDNIESISVLKNDSATAIYGERGKDGVILITTKKPENFTIDFKESTTKVQENVKSLNEMLEKDKPLIVIDGEKKSKDYDLKSINPNDIESFTILKDKSAVELYGEDGRNGVIIVTKKSKLLEYKSDVLELKNNGDFSLSGDKVEMNAGENQTITVSAKPVKSIVKKSDKSSLIIRNEDGSQPLVVVDGVKKGKLKEFNPGQFAVFRAYAGNTAKEKYGEEGANGVVEIDTKK